MEAVSEIMELPKLQDAYIRSVVKVQQADLTQIVNSTNLTDGGHRAKARIFRITFGLLRKHSMRETVRLMQKSIYGETRPKR